MIITKPNELHNCILNDKREHRHLCFWFNPSCDFIFKDFLSHDFGKNNLIRPDEKSKEKLLQVYEELRVATEEHDSFKQFYLTLEILGILRAFIKTENKASQFPKTLSEILTDIDLNFRDINSLNYFTSKYYMSASTLNRIFRQYLHTTPKMYLETKRLAYARRLLKQGKTINEASRESGFSTPSNFIRLFKKRFSSTPKQYQDGK